MIARKCDRCGGFYELDYKRSLVTIDTPNHAGRQYDLCPICTEDFEIWIKDKGYVVVKEQEE